MPFPFVYYVLDSARRSSSVTFRSMPIEAALCQRMDTIASKMDLSQEQLYLHQEDQHFLLRDILISAYGSADSCHSNGNHFCVTAVFPGFEVRLHDDCSYQDALVLGTKAATEGARYVRLTLL